MRWLWLVTIFVCVLGMNSAQAKVIRDVAYGSDKLQNYDVYLPEGDARGAPVMVMVHGGAWKIGDKSYRPVWKGKTEHWLPKGAVLIAVNYRMLPEADVGMQAQDVAAALAHIQAYGAQAGWDMARMVVMGHSAGGHLVVLNSVDVRYGKAVGLKPWLATIALDSAVYDVPELMSQRHFRLYDEPFGDDPHVWQRYSPLHHIDDAQTPMLLVCSSRREVSCGQAEHFKQVMVSKGGKVYVLPKDMNHGDINDELGKDAVYTAQVDDYLNHIGWMIVQPKN